MRSCLKTIGPASQVSSVSPVSLVSLVPLVPSASPSFWNLFTSLQAAQGTTFPFFYFFGSRGHSPVGPLGRPCAALALHPTVQLWHRSPSLITTPAWGSAPPIPGGRIIAVTAKPWAEATTHYPHTKGLSWRAMEKVANPFKVTNIATGS